MFGDLFARLEQVLGAVLAWFFDLLTPPLSHGVALGVGIIMLTITINLVVFPLTLKQTRATRAFTAIQPKIKKIQAEYKDDPQEMQKRLMAAQKEAGATPGGCLLPLLVQMPIWFALFRMLRTPFKFVIDQATKLPTAELVPGALHSINPDSALGRSLLTGEPNTFLGMALDTSPAQALQQGLKAAIPYLLMMALMVATQYVQQWHSTYGQERPDQKGAGAQQAVTRIMPLFIGFISYNFPAGLVLYWSTSNLFRFGQQALIFKIDGRPTLPGGSPKDSKPDPDPKGIDPKKPQPGASNKRRRRKRR